MNIKWVSIVSTTYVHNILHSKRNGEREMIKNYVVLHVEYLLFL